MNSILLRESFFSTNAVLGSDFLPAKVFHIILKFESIHAHILIIMSMYGTCFVPVVLVYNKTSMIQILVFFLCISS